LPQFVQGPNLFGVKGPKTTSQSKFLRKMKLFKRQSTLTHDHAGTVARHLLYTKHSNSMSVCDNNCDGQTVPWSWGAQYIDTDFIIVDSESKLLLFFGTSTIFLLCNSGYHKKPNCATGISLAFGELVSYTRCHRPDTLLVSHFPTIGLV
jgi:hypothetical protein